MKALGAIALVLIVLLAGGAITSNLLSSDIAIRQTARPQWRLLDRDA